MPIVSLQDQIDKTGEAPPIGGIPSLQQQMDKANADLSLTFLDTFQQRPRVPSRYVPGATTLARRPRQDTAERAAVSEFQNTAGFLHSIGAGGELQEALEDEKPSTMATLTTGVFDFIQAGNFASTGLADELLRTGSLAAAFTQGAIEFGDAFFGIENEKARKMVYGDVLKKHTDIDPTTAATLGFVMDILLDPLTWTGFGLGKGLRVLRGVDDIPLLGTSFEAGRVAESAIRRTRPALAFREKFVPKSLLHGLSKGEGAQELADVMNRLNPEGYDDTGRLLTATEVAEGGEKYLAELIEKQSTQEEKFRHLREMVIDLSANMSRDERAMMGSYLDQPKVLETFLSQSNMSEEAKVFFREAQTKWKDVFDEWFTREQELGILSPTSYRSNYAFGTKPFTALGRSIFETFARLRFGDARAARIADEAEPAARIVTDTGKAAFAQRRRYPTNESRALDLFPTEFDIGMLGARRGMESIRKTTTVKFMDTILNDKRIAVQIEDSIAKNVHDPLHDELKQAGLELFKGPNGIPGKEGVYYAIPRAMKEHLDDANKLFTPTTDMQRFMSGFREVQGLWKAYALMSPGYHLRNVYSNVFNNWLAGVNNPNKYVEAMVLQVGDTAKLPRPVRAMAEHILGGRKTIDDMKFTMSIDNRKVTLTGTQVLEEAKKRGVDAGGLIGADTAQSIEYQIMTGATDIKKASKDIVINGLSHWGDRAERIDSIANLIAKGGALGAVSTVEKAKPLAELYDGVARAWAYRNGSTPEEFYERYLSEFQPGLPHNVNMRNPESTTLFQTRSVMPRGQSPRAKAAREEVQAAKDEVDRAQRLVDDIDIDDSPRLEKQQDLEKKKDVLAEAQDIYDSILNDETNILYQGAGGEVPVFYSALRHHLLGDAVEDASKFPHLAKYNQPIVGQAFVDKQGKRIVPEKKASEIFKRLEKMQHKSPAQGGIHKDEYYGTGLRSWLKGLGDEGVNADSIDAFLNDTQIKIDMSNAPGVDVTGGRLRSFRDRGDAARAKVDELLNDPNPDYSDYVPIPTNEGLDTNVVRLISKEDEGTWSLMATNQFGEEIEEHITTKELRKMVDEAWEIPQADALARTVPQYFEYSLKGGRNKNYREILFSWVRKRVDSNNRFKVASKHYGGGYQEPPDDVFASMRLSDIETINPITGAKERTLLINELQSDWLQGKSSAGTSFSDAIDDFDIPKTWDDFREVTELPKARDWSERKTLAEGEEGYFVREVSFDYSKNPGQLRRQHGHLGVDAWPGDTHYVEYVKIKREKDLSKPSKRKRKRTIETGEVHDEGVRRYTAVARTSFPGGATLEEAQSKALRQINDSFRHALNEYPENPFGKTWHTIAMKRIMRMASDEGYDRVAWTSDPRDIYLLQWKSQGIDLEHLSRSDWNNLPLVTEELQKQSPQAAAAFKAIVKRQVDQKSKTGLWRAVQGMSDDAGWGLTPETVGVRGGGEMTVEHIEQYAKYPDTVTKDVIMEEEVSEELFSIVGQMKNNPDMSWHQAEASSYVKELLSKLLKRSDRTFDYDSISLHPNLQTQPQRVFQRRGNGKITGAVDLDGSPVIYAAEGSNESTFLHEFAHIARRFLMDEGDEMTLNRWAFGDAKFKEATELGGDGQMKWGVPEEEKFAEAFEIYLRQGVPPHGAARAMEATFGRIKEAMQDLTDFTQDSVSYSDDMKEVVRRLLGRGTEDEPETLRTINDIMEATRTAPKEPIVDRAKRLVGDNVFTKTNQALGRGFENNSRLAHFIHMMESGTNYTSLEDAAGHSAKSVKRFLFDYSELTTFERDVMKSVIPFYTWMRKNIPLQFQMLIEKPEQYSKIPKMMQEINGIAGDAESIPTPDYFEEINAVRLPWNFRGQPAFIGQDLPFQDINRLNLKDMVANMSPFLKIWAEVLPDRGFSLFKGAPIEQFAGESQYVDLFGEAVELPWSEKAQHVIETFLPPVGRYVTRPARKIAQGKGEEQFLRDLAGLSVTSVDVDAVVRGNRFMRREVARRVKQKFLKRANQLGLEEALLRTRKDAPQ